MILTICITTDIGGYVFGKTFKGPKLVNISPNKTYSGVVGGFLTSIIAAYLFDSNFNSYFQESQNFLDDLYSGALLNDMSQQDIENIDRVIPLEELLQMEEEAKAKEAAAAAAAATDEESVVDRILNEALEEDAASLDDIIGDEYDDGYEYLA